MAKATVVKPRTERIQPGVWRLKLPCPWPGVPHGNAWALQRGAGLVLVDTGVGGPGRLRMLDVALAQSGFGVDDIELVVCTHSHSDHYGLAASICERTGCELWMHPRWEHIRLQADDPQMALEGRLEVARMSGVPAAALDRYREGRIDKPADRNRRHPRPRPRPRPRGRGGVGHRHLAGRSRPPATLPRTSACTSPSAACSSPATTCSAARCCSSTTATPPTRSANTWRASTGSSRSPSTSACPATANRSANRWRRSPRSASRPRSCSTGPRPARRRRRADRLRDGRGDLGRENLGAGNDQAFVLQIVLSCLDHLAVIGEAHPRPRLRSAALACVNRLRSGLSLLVHPRRLWREHRRVALRPDRDRGHRRRRGRGRLRGAEAAARRPQRSRDPPLHAGKAEGSTPQTGPRRTEDRQLADVRAEPGRAPATCRRRGIKPPFRSLWHYTERPLLEFPPVYANGVLYAVNNNGTAFALDSETGKVLWERQIGRLNASSPDLLQEPPLHRQPGPRPHRQARRQNGQDHLEARACPAAPSPPRWCLATASTSAAKTVSSTRSASATATSAGRPSWAVRSRRRPPTATGSSSSATTAAT